MDPLALINWSDQPCHMTSFPPRLRKPRRSGLSEAIIGPTFSTLSLKYCRNPSGFTERQSQFGSRYTQYRFCSGATANGVAPPNAPRSVPWGCPYQRRLLPLPVSLREATSGTSQSLPFAQATGPFHMASMAVASPGVRHFASDAEQEGE